jgi:Tol biopolymer transport system component
MIGAAAQAILLGARGQEIQGQSKKFLDPATEFEILRVTGVAHNAWLPVPENHAFTRRGDALIYASDLAGAPQVYRADLKTNKLKRISEAQRLRTDAFTLYGNDRALLYVDGMRLLQSSAAGGKEKAIFELPDRAIDSARIAVAADGGIILLAACAAQRVRIYQAQPSAKAPLLEFEGSLGNLSLRPDRPAYSFVSNGVLHLATLASRKSTALDTAKGEVLSAVWSPGGAAILYLLDAKEAGRLIELRQHEPESKKDTLIARTTQYGHFVRNSDGSVILGASRSKASPHLLLLLPSVKRELTLCEHKCSDAARTRAVFSPNNLRAAFQTDRDGKMVIYALDVDRLVDQPEDASGVSDSGRRVSTPNVRR